MSMIFAIFLPIILAVFIPLLYKKAKRIHTGWFVLIAPLILVVLYALYIPSVMDGKTFSEEMPWIPSLDISFISYIDGLSLLFSLLIKLMKIMHLLKKHIISCVILLVKLLFHLKFQSWKMVQLLAQ